MLYCCRLCVAGRGRAVPWQVHRETQLLPPSGPYVAHSRFAFVQYLLYTCKSLHELKKQVYRLGAAGSTSVCNWCLLLQVSGEVYAVDDFTILLVNFNYDGTGDDTFFWAGDSGRPGPQGFIVPNEYGR